MRRAWPGLLLACACTTQKDPPEGQPAGPDAKALAIETIVKARTVTIVLSSRWADDVKLKADKRTQPAGGIVRGTGHASLKLRELRVEADEIELRFQTDPEYEDILLHAREVELFHQRVKYGHRSENADLVTMANDHINVMYQ